MIAWENLGQFGKVWLAVWALLSVLGCYCCQWLHVIGAGVTAVLLADYLLMAYDIVAPRHNIKDADKKAVLITGCDTGFGNKLASRLASLGFRVYAGCLATDCAGAKQLDRNHKIRVLNMNVTKQEDLDQVLEAVQKDLQEKHLTLWSVVNNAGIALLGEIELQSMSEIRQTFEVNTFAPVMVTKTFLPLLRAARHGGRLVNVASMAGRGSLYAFGAYCMSKHAEVALSGALRLELKKWNITVHTIEPAGYKTDIFDQENIRERLQRMVDDAGQDLRAAYGEDYLAEYVRRVVRGTDTTTRPADRVSEVVDDMVDAVAGTSPKIRYVPSAYVQIMDRVSRCLPYNALDIRSSAAAPKCKPAAMRR